MYNNKIIIQTAIIVANMIESFRFFNLIRCIRLLINGNLSKDNVKIKYIDITLSEQNTYELMYSFYVESFLEFVFEIVNFL
jgi:hypothetical protein